MNMLRKEEKSDHCTSTGIANAIICNVLKKKETTGVLVTASNKQTSNRLAKQNKIS